MQLEVEDQLSYIWIFLLSDSFKSQIHAEGTDEKAVSFYTEWILWTHSHLTHEERVKELLGFQHPVQFTAKKLAVQALSICIYTRERSPAGIDLLTSFAQDSLVSVIILSA